MTIYELLSTLDIPCVYSHFRNEDGVIPQEPPYIAYLGAGQTHATADNRYILKRNIYQIEYYFTKKDEALEETIETLLEDNGFLFDKSSDAYIDEEDVFVIYYTAYAYHAPGDAESS